MKRIILLFLVFCAGLLNAQTKIDFNKLNDKYYHIYMDKFPGFSADLESNTLDDFHRGMAQVKAFPMLDSLALYLNYNSPENYAIKEKGLNPTGNPQFDANIKKMLEEVKQTVSAGLNSWGRMIFYDFYDPAENNYQIKKKGNAYEITYERDSAFTAIYLNSMYDIDSVSISSGANYSVMKFQFSEYNKKKLIQSARTEISHGLVSLTVQINYKEVGGYMLPQKFYITQSGFGNHIVSEVVLRNVALHKRSGK